MFETLSMDIAKKRFANFPIFDWASILKIEKPYARCLKSGKVSCSESLQKTKSNVTICGVMVILVQFEVVQARKRVWIENYHQDAITRNVKPKFPQQSIVGTLFTEIAKNGSYFSDFWLGIPTQNHKNRAPVVECQGKKVFWKLVKN